MRVGYCRPPAGHGPNKQREALEAAGCELVVDSGIASLLGSVDAGDVVVVASLGALGSTSASAVRAALEIGAKAAELVVLDQGIDTSKEEHGAFFRHAAAIMGVDEDRKGSRAKPGHTGGKSKVDPSPWPTPSACTRAAITSCPRSPRPPASAAARCTATCRRAATATVSCSGA